MIIKAGFPDVITMTEIKKGTGRKGERVIIIDVIGELFSAYSLATVVFCGGSLVPKGGQNILEAAAWGKVVLYGPSMDDFADERAALEAEGAGITVKDGRELAGMLVALMEDRASLEARGKRGRDVVLANRGASERYAAMITDALENRR